MSRRTRRTHAANALLGAAALVVAAGARRASRTDLPTAPQTSGPLARAAVAFASAPTARYLAPKSAAELRVDSAIAALAPAVRTQSHPRALEDAVRSYFAFRAAHPEAATKPYLYFVDYGLPSTTPRGYVFDMAARQVVEGPFTVAHGRGSSESQTGVPMRFSNAFGSAATSLGLYVAQELYPFRGHAGGQAYNSLGMRLEGVSEGYNDLARLRRVVAHGAPYVTDAKAGRSEGCPALEPSRAERLLPKLANGGLVFLFAPDARWMAGDPWITERAG